MKTLNLGRRSTLVLMLALHAATSLCGPGHHAVDGWFDRIAGVECVACDREDQGDTLHADQDCPACDFFTLAVLPTEQPPTASSQSVRSLPSRVETVDIAPPRYAVSIPRAPPSGSA